MLSASRVSSLLLTLSLSLIISASSQLQALALNGAQSSDEVTLLAMTEQYASAIMAGNLGAIREFWNPQSPNRTGRLRSYQNIVSEVQIEFIDPKVTVLEITNGRAVTKLTADERRTDKKTGAMLLISGILRGTMRSYEWINTGAGWKVEREFLVQDELAARLEATTSEHERDELLEKEKVLVTNALITALAARGIRHSTRADYEATMRCFHLQEHVAEKIGDKAGLAGALSNIGLVKHLQEEHELGLELTHKALALYDSMGLKYGVAVTLEKLSNIYRALGDYRRAFDVTQKSLRLCEEERNRRGTVMALSELATIYGSQNNQEQALSHFEKALAIAQEIGDTIMTATLRHDMAVQFQRLGNYERALGILQGLLKQTEDSGDLFGAAMVRNQIGQVHALRGAYDEALSYYNQSMTNLDTANMKRATVVVLNDISEAYLAKGKNDEALSAAERAVSLSRETGRQLDIWLALTFRGYAQLALNRALEAKHSFAEAVSIIEKLRAQTAGGVEERQRYFEGGLRAHHGMLDVLVKENKPREALVFAERAKARVLLDVLQQGRVSVQKAMTAGELEQERRLKSELTQLNLQLGGATQSDNPDAARVGEIQRRLEKTRLAYEAFQNSLYAAHPELKVQRGEAPIIDAEELTALLPDARSALLEYVVTADKTYLFVITRTAAKEHVDVRVYTIPIKLDELARKTRAFRRQLAERDLGFRASAVKLYELLLKPAQAQLRDKTNIIIAPDDALWDLPFQALPTSGNRFLIEDAAVAYAPSLTVLREMTRRKSEGADVAPPTLLAFGNPLLGKETVNRATLTLRDVRISSLPEAGQEVMALRRLYGVSRSKVYIGADAREDRVKREAGQARILHFAAHGTLNNVSPMYSHLALAKGGAGEDGLLEAWELMQLDLKADLAVLSACETARGRIGAGEGMVGLSWAMFIAGVPSTVVSQWKVEAASTRDLMVSFHRGLILQPLAGKPKPSKTEALRQAALRLMRNSETRHPFYWAGFVLVGQGM